MSRGFGKYRRGASHHSFHFDKLFKENSNRPSAARSAASVGKWGITSFTSIRNLNGRQENEQSTAPAPKPKKFFKSRDANEDSSNTTPSYSSSASYEPPTKKARSSSREYSDRQTKSSSSPKKFYASKNAQEKVLPSKRPIKRRRSSDKSDISETSKPPIVLRICRGKSQLVSDTDDSDKATTPNTTPKSASTSPRALRETSNSQTSPRPSNCRITRSARRSMQMDPSSSPVSSDTASEFTMFIGSRKESPKSEMSPQYVPAEKFEEERRALYASLLKPDSPKLIDNSEHAPDQPPTEELPLSDVPQKQDENIAPSEPQLIDDQLVADKSIEDVMAVLHGGVEESVKPEEPKIGDTNSEPYSAEAEGDMELELIISESVSQDKADVTESQEEESLESRLAKLDAESSQQHTEEIVETIENIAKEIENTKASKPAVPARGLRKRSKPKDVMEFQEEIVEDKTVKPSLRGGLRNRSKTTNNIQELVEEVKEFIDPEKKAKAKDKNVKEKNFPIVKIKEIPLADPISNKSNKKSIEDEWGTDSDSNSTVPESEVKQTIIPSTDQPANEVEKSKDVIPEKNPENPPDPPPVKLVISKKKGSIFKSRALVDDGTKKRTARYVHKWTDKDGGETPARPPTENVELDSNFEFKGDPLTRVTLTDESQDVTSVKCTTADKGFYMVVRNVKKAHQIQEIGEFQEFNDDVEYILDALQDNNPVSTRCLSAITLASKCMVPAFRMHVRAHGTVAKFFKALHDATKDQSLGLCTATVMFVLSQDRLNMDLDRDCLELMLNLLESDVSYQQALDVCGLTSAQLEKNKQKVRELCGEIQSQGHAMHLNLENITTGQLAMETLLSLTSKRAGEWFKEELRELGGLEHIMKTICECCRQVSDYVVSWTDPLLDKLKKVDRCLRVLENVTQNNEENQTYILKYNDGMMIDTLVNLYKLCDVEIPLYPVTDIADKSSKGTIIREALLVTLKVLINLTHHYRQQSIGSQLIGSRPGIIETSLHLLLQVPNYIPEQKKFELGVLVLMLLINLIQDQEANKKLLIDAKAPSKLESIYSREESAVEALIVQFYEWEGCAKIAENKTNAILDGEKDEQDPGTEAQPQNKSNEEFIEETVAKLLQKAGTHMEYTFLASYIVMLVGFLIMENEVYQDNIRQFLRENNFTDMVELLKKFYNFMNLTASTEASSVCAVKATQKVIKYLETCDQSESEENKDHKDSEPIDLVVPYL
uniref:WAPL domain-containing protein n=1 Tax=Dendroctonus ponderosae TaxID=77166 RepID=A0AAR5Q3I4_DENPD